MKKTLKIISIVSILLFGILWILSKFIDSTEFNTIWEYRDGIIKWIKEVNIKLDNDIITKTIGRKSVLDLYKKKYPSKINN